MKFQQMPCIRCGSNRILGMSCPECGMSGPAGEVNSDVVRRRTGLRKINEIVDALSGNPEPLSALPDRDEILPLVEDLAAGIGVFAQSNGSAFAVKKLSEVISKLADLRSRASNAPLRRPTITLTRTTKLTLDRLAAVWFAWEEVLRSPSVSEVQRLTPIAQELLDNAGSDFSAYRAVADAVAAYEDYSEPSILKRSLNALRFTNPGLSLLDLATEGALQATTELGIPVSQGKGAEFLALGAIARAHLDPVRITQVLTETSAFCLNNVHLVETSQSPGAIEGLAHGQRLILESLKAFEAIVQAESNNDSLLRRMISLYGEIYEDVAAPIFAWYCRLAGLKSKSYEKLMKLNATDLAASLLSSSVTSSWFLGAESYLRNAAGHGRSSYSITDDMVTFKLNSFSETVPVANILDKFFALFESLAALSWSLENALEQAGIDVPMMDDDAEYAGLSAFHLSCSSLEQAGEILHTARNQNDAWEIELGHGDTQASQIAMSLALQEQTGFLHATVRRRGTTDPMLSMPVDLVVDVVAMNSDGSDPDELLLAILRLRLKSTANGRSILTRQDVEFAICAFSLHFLSPNVGYARLLREARNIAIAAGYLETVDLSDRVFAEFRKSTPASAHRLAAELHAFVHHEAPTIPSSNNARVVFK